MSRKLRERCHSVLTLVPILLDFFRQSRIGADEFILEKSKGQGISASSRSMKGKKNLSIDLDEETENALTELCDNYESEDRMSVTQLKLVYSTFDEEVWPKAILYIVSQSTPPLLDEGSVKSMVDLMNQNKQEITVKDSVAGGLLGPVLDELPRMNFEVLGAFFAFIRDNSRDGPAVCKSIARKMLKHGSSKDLKALFQLMVDKAEPLFGRIAAVKSVYY